MVLGLQERCFIAFFENNEQRKDNNNIRARRTAKERVRRVRMMLRIRTIRVKEVSVKQNPARRQRRIGIQITRSTQVKITDMDMDMMTIRIIPQTNRTRNQRRPNRRKKNHMTTRKDGRVNMDTRSRRNRNQLRTTSQSLRQSLRLCRSVPRTWQKSSRRIRF